MFLLFNFHFLIVNLKWGSVKIIRHFPFVRKGLKCSQPRYWTVIGKYYDADKENKLAGKRKQIWKSNHGFDKILKWRQKCSTFERAQIALCHPVLPMSTSYLIYENINISTAKMSLCLYEKSSPFSWSSHLRV